MELLLSHIRLLLSHIRLVLSHIRLLLQLLLLLCNLLSKLLDQHVRSKTLHSHQPMSTASLFLFLSVISFTSSASHVHLKKR